MDRESALTALRSDIVSDRLSAARILSTEAHLSDVEFIRGRFLAEEVPWIRRVLLDTIRRLELPTRHEAAEEVLSLDVPEDVYQAIYARAIEEVTRQVVHEVRTVVGTAEYYAARQIPEYESSRASPEFGRLKRALDSVSSLGEAAGTPVLRQFDLAELVQDTTRDERKSAGVDVAYVGSKPFLVDSDPGLVEMIVRNAVRNACESTATMPKAAREAVTVRWMSGDDEFIVSVTDRGAGLPESRSRAWDVGVSTKRGHSGVGLAMVRQAAHSLGASVDLRPGRLGGAVFEARFPKTVVGS